MSEREDGHKHEVEVRYQQAWSEWRAECSPCRWIGSYMKSKRAAEDEAARHVEGTQQ